MSSYFGEGPYAMEETAWLVARQAADAFARTNRTNFQTERNRSSTNMLIQELRFAPAKSIRTSTIVLAVFNIIAAFATVLGILWENYSREKRNRKFSIRRDGLNFVQGPEVYPLFLSIGITIQGIIFATAQANGLENFLISGCALIAQSVLPALVLVPAIQFIFGLEVMLRGLRNQPFPKRGPWAVRLCLTLVGMVCLAAFLTSHISRTPDFCFASLFWFTAHYATGIFVLFLVITIILLGATVTIFLKLSRNVSIEATERVAASRMVYYLALAVISNAFVLPFFQQLAFEDQRDDRFSGLPLTLSMVASVVTEVSGLMTGGLHLFLRSNTISAIGPKDKFEKDDGHEKLKSNIRIRSNQNSYEDSGITSPNGLRRINSDDSMISHYKKDEEAGMMMNYSPSPVRPTFNTPRSTDEYPQPRSNDEYPQPPEPSYVARASQRIKSSAFFSAIRPISTKPPATLLLPATTYSPTSPGGVAPAPTTVKPHRFDFSTLKPPPAMKNLGVGRHRRDSSIASHITVQLGLRLSNVGDIGRSVDPRESCTATIPLMVEQPREPPRLAQPKPSPLARAMRSASVDDSDVDDELFLDSRKPTPMQQDREMPPMPRPIQTMQQEEKPLTLSPTVYSPHSASPKLVSPRGVGFTSPPTSRFNSQTTQRSGSQRSTTSTRSSPSQRSPPPRNPSSASNRTKPSASSNSGGDWI